MRATRFYFIILLAIVAALGYLMFRIIQPFLVPIMWAIVLSIVFYPLYVYIKHKLKWKWLSSLIVLLIITSTIIGPFSYFSYLFINEIRDIASHMGTGKIEAAHDIVNYPAVRSILNWIKNVFNLPFTDTEIEQTIMDSAAAMGKRLVESIPVGIGSLVNVFINYVFMSLAIFVMLKDGAAFLLKSRDYMPFSEQQKDRLAMQVRDIVISTIYGGVLVAIMEGIIASVAYSGLGLRSPALWGAATAAASFVPMLGGIVVWGGIAIYMFLKISVIKGIEMTLIGIFGISPIDYGLRPILIGNRTRLPAVVIFFSILGGIEFFGMLGLIMGPLVVALFLSVMEIFRTFEADRSSS